MKTTLYALVSTDGEVRYIGKTSGPVDRRLKAHISDARRGGGGHKAKWIRAMLRAGERPGILPLCEVVGSGGDIERVLISAFRASPALKLTNTTAGGEGAPGVRRTEAEKLHLSILNKGRKITWGEKISASKRGVKFSDAHRAALSMAQRSSGAVRAARAARAGRKMPVASIARTEWGRRKLFAARGLCPLMDLDLSA